MLGDMMKNMQEQQDQMQSKLKQIQVSVVKNGITINANAAREILNISIDNELLQDKDQLEDMLIVAINELQLAISEKEGEASQDLMSKMLPGGLSGLGSLFS